MKSKNLRADDKSTPSNNLQRRVHNSQLHTDLLNRKLAIRVWGPLPPPSPREPNGAYRVPRTIGRMWRPDLLKPSMVCHPRRSRVRAVHYSRSLLCTLRAPLGPASQYSFPCEFSPLFRCHLRKAGLSSLKSAQPTEGHCVRILDLLLSGHFTNSLSQIRSNSNVLAFTIALWYISIP